MQIPRGLTLWIYCVCLMLIGAGPLFFTTGCKPSSEKIAAREALLNQEVESLFVRVQELESQNQTDQALQLVDSGIANPKYKAYKSRFFTQKIDLFLAHNFDQKACEVIIGAWKNEPEIARPVFGRVYNHYLQLNSFSDIRKWCKSLLTTDIRLPHDLRSQVLDWQLAAALSMGDEESSKAGFDEILSSLTPDEAAPIIQRTLTGLVDSGRQGLALSLTRYLEGKKLDSPLYRNLYASMTVRCFLTAKDWNNITPAFNACVAQLPDDQLLGVSRAVFSVMLKNGRQTDVEQLSQQVINQATEKTNSVNYASRIWVDAGVNADKKLLAERLDALLKAKVSPVQVGNLFDRYFYEMTGDLEVIRSLCAIGDRIIAVCKDQDTVNSVKVKVLDGAFITDNFDLAVHMLEQGIPGKDKQWHDMSLPKVKAHRALANKQPREAVKYFRDFMNAWLASDQQEEFDPTSGIAYSREWILGRNANRIAGILDSIPDKAEADKARAEAKAYFKTALVKAANDTEALKLLKQETKDMGL